jgi:hypothetical protein
MLVYFFLAGWTAACGFWQLRFSRWFGRDSSKSLLWLCLLSSFIAVAGSWTLALRKSVTEKNNLGDSSVVSPKQRTIEEVVLWIVIGLCLALGVAWETYPRIYMHVHHPPHGQGSSYTWRNEGFGPSQLVRSFFYACLIAGPGFAQLRFSQWFHRDTSKILLRPYLSAGLVMVVGMWTFDLANRFWTVEDNRLYLLGARGTEVGTTLFRLGRGRASVWRC